ncbi:Cleavage stimulation factor subunit 2 hinge domain-containing protein [Entamoeba marina]
MEQVPRYEAKVATQMEVRKAVESVDPQQLNAVILEKLVQDNREKAQQLLTDNPSLSFALLEALHTMQLIDKNTYDTLTSN